MCCVCVLTKTKSACGYVLILHPPFNYLAYCIAEKFGGELKFGGLAVCVKTAKLNSAKFFYMCMYVWQYRTISPNLCPLMVLKRRFGPNRQI